MHHFATIVSNEQLVENIFDMTVYCPDVAQTARPGQFAHIRVRDSIDPLLRRPISICDVNKEKGTVRFIYRKHGYGTNLLSKYKGENKTDTVRTNIKNQLDILAPLGNGKFPVEIDCQEVYIIGGGIGTPPLLFAAKELATKGIKVISILGFATKNHVILESDFSQFGDVHVYTIDGSYGKKGLVTDYLFSVNVDVYLACGPLPMLKALKNHSFLTNAQGYLSFEEHMACGIGACMGCVTKVKQENEEKEDTSNSISWNYAKICDCGPVFASDKVVFE